MSEKEVAEIFAKKWGITEKEVQCELNYMKCGRCDLVYGDYAIEVKHAKEWKHALGQVLVYAVCLGKIPVLYLYGDDEDYNNYNPTTIASICGSKGCYVIFREYTPDQDGKTFSKEFYHQNISS